MADYINFEAEADFVEDINQDVGDEVSDFSDFVEIKLFFESFWIKK